LHHLAAFVPWVLHEVVETMGGCRRTPQRVTDSNVRGAPRPKRNAGYSAHENAPSEEKGILWNINDAVDFVGNKDTFTKKSGSFASADIASSSRPSQRTTQRGGTKTTQKAVAKAVPQPTSGQPQKSTLMHQPAQGEVLAAVRSLYKDELKPYGRILRKRLVERAAEAGRGPVDIDGKHLHGVCAGCDVISVESEFGGEWSAVLIGTDQNFVDVYSPLDVYREEMWAAARVYFEQLDGAHSSLPGGRYSCAQTLASRALPFLAGHSLGQICHIVQLAISQRKILGYLNGSIVPYGRSQSMIKECCADWQRPCATSTSSTGTPEMQLATWDVARACLKKIMDTARASGKDKVPMSNVKRLFRSQYHMELSETLLGFQSSLLCCRIPVSMISAHCSFKDRVMFSCQRCSNQSAGLLSA